jgi:hypothetical protein
MLILMLLFCGLAAALNITQPKAGANLDPTTPMIIAWTSTTSDPPTIDLNIEGGDSAGEGEVLGTNVSVTAGKFVVPANAINVTMAAGEQFQISVNTPGDQGNQFVARSGAFRFITTANGTTSSSAPSATASNGASGKYLQGIDTMLMVAGGVALIMQ